MSSYAPPVENVAIFDTINFTSGEQTLTQNQADKRYLRFPNAQGTENLQAVNVNGLATFNSFATFNDAVSMNETLTMSSTSGANRQITSTFYNLRDLNSASVGGAIYQSNQTFNYDNNENGGNHTFATNDSSGTQTIPLTLSSALSTFTSNVQCNEDLIIVDGVNQSRILQSGSTLTVDNNVNSGIISFKINNSTGVETTPLSITSTQISSIAGSTMIQNNTGIIFNKPFDCTASAALDRSIYASNFYLKNTNTAGSNIGRIYYSSPEFIYDNDTTTVGVHRFYTNNSSGVQTTPLLISSATTTLASDTVNFSAVSGDVSFSSTNPPTSSQTIPASNDSSNKIPTTAWVQSAISGISHPFQPTFWNYSDTQTVTGASGYSNGPILNFTGTWAPNDIAYFRIYSQVSYSPDGNGEFQGASSTMGMLYFRPYYFFTGWAPVSGTAVIYPNNVPSSTCGANKLPCFYVPSFNQGPNSGKFYLNGGTKSGTGGSCRLSCLNPTGGADTWLFFVSIEYLGGRSSAGNVTITGGSDTNGINNTLP